MADNTHAGTPRRLHHVCPWWLGYLLVSPLRRLFEPAAEMIDPYVRPGMTVLEPGCGMGFFSLPLARLVGDTGRVYAVDLQPRMIAGLRRRASRAGLSGRIVSSVCTAGDLGLAGLRAAADLAFALHMVHEVPDRAGLLRQLHDALRPGGSLVVFEPKGHVSPADLETTIALAEQTGFVCAARPATRRSLGAVMVKPAA